MAKVPQYQRLTEQDFPDQTGWIGRLLSPINLYFEQVNSVLNKGITLGDNMAAVIKTVELDGNFPVKLAWGLSSRPVSVLVGNTYRSDGSAFTLTSAVQVQWSYNQAAQLQIDHVVGISPTSSAKFKVVLECKIG